MRNLLYVVMLSSLLVSIGATAQQVTLQCNEPEAIPYRGKKTPGLINKNEFPGAAHDQYVMNYKAQCVTNISQRQTGPLPQGRLFDALVFRKIIFPRGGPDAPKIISGPELLANGFRKTIYKMTMRTGSDSSDVSTIAAASKDTNQPEPTAIEYEMDMTVTLTTNDLDRWIIDWRSNNDFCNGDVCADPEHHNIRLLNKNLQGNAKYAVNLEELQVAIDITKAPGTGLFTATLTGLTRVNNPKSNFTFNLANKVAIHSESRAKEKLTANAGWQVKELLSQTMMANNSAPLKRPGQFKNAANVQRSKN